MWISGTISAYSELHPHLLQTLWHTMNTFTYNIVFCVLLYCTHCISGPWIVVNLRLICFSAMQSDYRTVHSMERVRRSQSILNHTFRKHNLCFLCDHLKENPGVNHPISLFSEYCRYMHNKVPANAILYTWTEHRETKLKQSFIPPSVGFGS